MVLKIFPAVLAAVLLANGAQAQAEVCTVSLPRSLIVVSDSELTLPPQFTDGAIDTCCTVSDNPSKRANRR